MIEAPERAHVLIAKFGADTAERLADELRFMADQIDREQLSTGCSGSPSGGAIYSYKIRPEQTHDAYFEQVEAWLSEQKRNPSPEAREVGTISRACVAIADQVEPDFRGKSKSCTSQSAKRWQAAYDGAHIAITGKPSEVGIND